IAIVWYALCIRTLMPGWRSLSPLFVLLFIGSVIRILYVSATPYGVRSHDLGGHLDYITFIRTHGHLPLASQGWEFHQAPLFYAFSAGWMELWERMLSLKETTLLYSLQAWALLFSILTLWVALSAARVLFSSKDRYGVLLFGLFLCVFPGVVFFSSRITNEVPALFFTVAFIVLLLRWWYTPRWRWLLGAGLMFALSFITKVSVIVLLPVAVLVFFLRKETLRVRVQRMLLFSVVVIAVAGWYPTLRLVVETNRTKTLSFGNDQMNHELGVPRDVRHLLTFNPVAVARQPFNDPWSDDARRGNLIEFFFRSSLFGEFKFPKQLWIAYPLVVSLLFLLPCFLYGIFREMMSSFRRLLPLHLTTFFLFLGAFLYPFLFAFVSNQDFRFSAALILPGAYYLTRGITYLPGILREIALGIFMAFVACAVVFVIALFMQA
ncbi:MAG: glycosyltransferase family 39 protein, partial [Candidatus Peribacteraceae bacterium]|nr:glycosyltransferase family 39 protein [Candidatus Peribacteraceae bacterium]